MKYNLIVADPAWEPDDKLKMGDTVRNSGGKYPITISTEDIINLKVKDIAADNSVLALWVIGSMLQEGMDTMKTWGFTQKQTWVWVKTKQNPLINLQKELFRIIKKEDPKEYLKLISGAVDEVRLDEVLNFFMGHLFRQTHEICLIGTRGKYTKLLTNKAQRSVHISAASKKHSEKPEELQDRLDIMFSGPNIKKCELFARRDRPGWNCTGWECPSTWHCDIRDEIERLSKLP